MTNSTPCMETQRLTGQWLVFADRVLDTAESIPPDIPITNDEKLSLSA